LQIYELIFSRKPHATYVLLHRYYCGEMIFYTFCFPNEIIEKKMKIIFLMIPKINNSKSEKIRKFIILKYALIYFTSYKQKIKKDEHHFN
jgi:hypothetical protein